MNKESIATKKLKEEELQKVTIKLDRLEERFVFEEITKQKYTKFKAQLDKEKNEKESELQEQGFNSSNLEKTVKKALNYVVNLQLF